MTTTEILFKKTGDGYECALTDYMPEMAGVIRLVLSEPSQIVSVRTGVAGLPPMVVQTLQTPYGRGLVFELDFPQGVGVVLSSSKPVTEGVWIS